MAKLPTCKNCLKVGHYRTFCPTLRKSPIKRAPVRAKPKKVTIPTKQAKKAKTPRQAAKDRAWKAFSDYIRIRDSLATTGTLDSCVCVTCAVRGDTRPKPYKTIQAGHAVGGRGNAVLFHEDLVNGQCGYCNRKPPMGLGGDYGNYAIHLIQQYGMEKAMQLQQLRHNNKVKYKPHDFIEIEQKYKQKALQLKQLAL